jgi:hypothetical protein
MVRIDFNRLRFLVIDDNAHMRRILRTLLHGFGTREVYEAEDGAAGLEAFTHYLPDIVPDEFLRAQNIDRPDYLESIFAPPLVPGAA